MRSNVVAGAYRQMKVINPPIARDINHYINLSVDLANNKKAWLRAEQESWGPWLASQNGFLQRELLWDRRNQEATVLISWSTRKAWKSIPPEEIEAVQEKFLKIAREMTGQVSGNPFPLQYEGELEPQ